MNRFFRISGLSLIFVTASCTGENSSVQPVTVLSESDAVAIVNGQPISKKVLQILASNAAKRTNAGKIPEESLIEEMIKRELLSQEALDKKLDRDPEIAQRLAFLKRSVLSQAAIQDFIKNTVVTDDQAKVEYDRRILEMGRTEYKARHILLKSEDKAKDIIKQLEKGGKFDALAKANSTGPSGPKGGELGWFNPQQMVPPFSQAVKQLQKGKFSKEPVKTQFGWHVILREDSRESAPPAFDDVKKNIIGQLQSEKLQDHIKVLKDAAEIIIKNDETKDAKAAAGN